MYIPCRSAVLFTSAQFCVAEPAISLCARHSGAAGLIILMVLVCARAYAGLQHHPGDFEQIFTLRVPTSGVHSL
jgi:hypothetical protein